MLTLKVLTPKISSELRKWSTHHHLPPTQTPFAIFLEIRETWNSENGFLTPTAKKKRHVLYSKYEREIKEMLERQKRRGDGGWREGGGKEKQVMEETTEEGEEGVPKKISPELSEILRNVFLEFRENMSGAEIDGNLNIFELGADSLVASRFCFLLKKKGTKIFPQENVRSFF
jgi:hypothetical protein